jgi:hypothetical protein
MSEKAPVGKEPTGKTPELLLEANGNAASTPFVELANRVRWS